jgi:PAS domain-containing protein
MDTNDEDAKRRQVRRACTNCRKAHACCDEQRPCQRCINLGVIDECKDAENKKRGRKRRVDGEQTESPPFGGPNLDFTVNTHFRQFNNASQTIDNSITFTQYAPPTTKRMRTTNLETFSTQQAPSEIPQLRLNIDFPLTTNSAISASTNIPNQTNYQIPIQNQLQMPNLPMLETELELQRLRDENTSLKQQLLTVATGASNFTKTLLGLDLASRVGVLLTVEGGRIVSWNSPLRLALGYEQDDLLTIVKSIRDIIAEVDLKRALSTLIDAVVNRRESCAIAISLKNKSGNNVPSQFTTMFAYDIRDQKPLFSISFISFGRTEKQDYMFTQQLQLMQLQGSQKRNLSEGRDISA